MKQRVIYGTLFALITVGMIVLCQPTRVIFFVTCALIAAHEMRKALEKCGYHPLAWPVMALCVSSTLLLYFGKAGYVFPVFMIIMIALGFGVFVGANMEWVSIEKNTNRLFEETGLADYKIYSSSAKTGGENACRRNAVHIWKNTENKRRSR